MQGHRRSGHPRSSRPPRRLIKPFPPPGRGGEPRLVGHYGHGRCTRRLGAPLGLVNGTKVGVLRLQPLFIAVESAFRSGWRRSVRRGRTASARSPHCGVQVHVRFCSVPPPDAKARGDSGGARLRRVALNRTDLGHSPRGRGVSAGFSATAVAPMLLSYRIAGPDTSAAADPGGGLEGDSRSGRCFARASREARPSSPDRRGRTAQWSDRAGRG